MYKFEEISGTDRFKGFYPQKNGESSVDLIVKALDLNSNFERKDPRIIGLVFTHRDLSIREEQFVQVAIEKDFIEILPHSNPKKIEYTFFVYRLISYNSTRFALEFLPDLSTNQNDFEFDSIAYYDKKTLDFVFFDAIQLIQLCSGAIEFTYRQTRKSEPQNLGIQIIFSGARVEYSGFLQKDKDENLRIKDQWFPTLKAEAILECTDNMLRPAVALGVPCPIMWGGAATQLASINCQKSARDPKGSAKPGNNSNAPDKDKR